MLFSLNVPQILLQTNYRQVQKQLGSEPHMIGLRPGWYRLDHANMLGA